MKLLLSIYLFSTLLYISTCSTTSITSLQLATPNEVDAYFDLPKIKTEITPQTKERILNGLKAAGQFMKFLQEKNFLQTLTKISSVAGPIFMVASAILEIAFLFIDIESPEMALMKKEFANLNNRIDAWGVEFNEIKRKIDWSAVQINFGNVENTIVNLANILKDLPNVDKSIREEQASRFLNKYRITYKASGDILYNSMINIQQVYSENLFKAAQKYYEYHRKMVQNFMMSNTVLLTQAMQIEAAYIKLKYNNDKANEYIKSTWDKRMNVLKEKMDEIDQQTKNQYSSQYQIDLDNLLKTQHGLSNQDFTSNAFGYFVDKYYWREWFVLTYAELSGFRDHTVNTCRGTHRFRQNGRNIIVSSIESETEADNALITRKEKEAIIGSYNGWRNNQNLSLGWVNYIRGRLPYCNQADTIASVAWGSNVWYMNTRLVVYKKNCVYGRSPCFNTFIFA